MSYQNSFVMDLHMTPYADYKTSSENEQEWSSDEEIDGYTSVENMSGVELFSGSESPRGSKRKLSPSSDKFRIMKESGRQIMKKLKTSLKLRFPCMTTQAEAEYDSDCTIILSSQISGNDKSVNWLENNLIAIFETDCMYIYNMLLFMLKDPQINWTQKEIVNSRRRAIINCFF